jgi:gamma-glutamyl-gamma-aminobutyrate hydrolase PuuD
MGRGSKYARKQAARAAAGQPQPKVEPEVKALVESTPSRVVTIIHDHPLVYPTLGMNVFIPEGTEHQSFAEMFARSGCRRVDDIGLADLLVFTGGADVDPQLYGEKKHKSTKIDSARDKRDMEVYAYGLEHNIPMFGVCRGAQFLHVMNGGKLYQDVDNHVGKHPMRDVITHETIGVVSSTHHQMCIEQVGKQTVLGVAWETKIRYRNSKDVETNRIAEVEAFFYEQTCCLGVQGHPEYAGYPKFTTWTLGLINQYICHNPKVEINDDARVPV